MSETEAAQPRARLYGYDFARAIAIIGMVLINFPIFYASMDETAGTPLAWIANIHYGRAAALFVTLAGAGIALMARGASPWRVRRTLALRSVFLFVLGNILLLLTWGIDILHFYAFYLALAAIFLITAPRWALLATIALIMAITLGLRIVWPDLTTSLDVSTAWPPSEDGPSYWSPLGMAQNVFISGIHPVLPWFAFITAGVWIGRHDLTDTATRARLMIIGASLAIGAPLVSTLLEQAPIAGLLPDATLNYLGVLHAPSPLYVLGAIGSSMFMIALSQMITTRFGGVIAVRALIHAGQMALTIYLAHALLGVVLPQSLFDLSGFPLAWVIAYALSFSLVAVTCAHFYRRHFSRGPVEMMMRWITGGTPEKEAPPSDARLRAPSPLWQPAVGAGLVALVALQMVGVQANLSCAPSQLEGARGAGALTLICPRQSFAVDVAERTDAVFETHSSRDLYLELYRGAEMIAQNDDGGQGANARLTWTLDPGAYRVVVRPYESSMGPFLLTRTDSEPTASVLLAGQICSDTCASARDTECDDGGPGSLYSVCEFGSDCADCGIRTDAQLSSMLDANGQLCANTCAYASDNECDDGGANALNNLCSYGSDCSDCGGRAPRFSTAAPR